MDGWDELCVVRYGTRMQYTLRVEGLVIDVLTIWGGGHGQVHGAADGRDKYMDE